ncbi:MAG: adenylate/guanylate cyclase domain-containing protein [Candidatus Riflebacteria bacterium]
MINEIELFRQKIDVEKFLQSRLRKFFAEKDLFARNHRADEIARLLREKFELGPSAVLINHPELNDQACFFLEKKLLEKIGFIGRSLTRKYINSRLLQEEIFSKAEVSGNELVSNRIKQQIAESDQFLLKQFGLISPVPVMTDQVFSSISAKANDRLFFYFKSIPDSNIGILIIFSGSDLKLKSVLKDSLNSDSPVIKRSFARKKMIADDLDQPVPEKMTRFIRDEKGLHLLAPFPQVFLSLIIQNSTFYPHLIDDFRRYVPLVKVSIVADKLQHPLKKWQRTIRNLCKTAVVASLLFCFYFGLFGFSIKIGVRQKAVLGIAFIAWLPLAIMMASYLTWNEISQIREGFEKDDRLSLIANDIALRFDSFLLKQQKITRKLADEIETFADADRDSLNRFIQNSLLRTFAREAYYDIVDREGVYVKRNNALVNPETDRSENFIRHALAVSLLQSVAYREKFEKGKFTNYEEQGLFRPTPEFINSLLNKKTRLFTFKSLNSSYAYTVEPVVAKNNGKVKSFICLRFEKNELIRQFIKTLANYNPNGILVDFILYHEHLGVFRYETTNRNLSLPGLQPIFDLVVTARSSKMVDLKNDRGLAFYIPDYPFMILCRSARTIEKNDLVPVFLMASYMALLVFLIFRLFGSLYVDPVMQLSQVAIAVANGNYSARTNINTFDEFDELNKTFDLMIQGVAQKEKLMQFVSADVANVVKADDDSSLFPGGERIDATIAFVTIAGIDQLLESKESEKLLDILEMFIAAGNEIALKNHGSLDKIIENTLMLVFRGDAAGKTDALRACFSILQLQQLLLQQNLSIHAGIACGKVISGKIGSRSGKLDFTVIGDPVNLAARLKGQAFKASQTGILVAASVIRKARGMVRVNYIDRVNLKGKARKYQLYELVSLRAGPNCEEKPC